MPADFWPSFARAWVIAITGAYISAWLGPALRQTQGRRCRPWLWALAIAPFIAPAALIAYGYLPLFMRLFRYPLLLEGVYITLLFLHLFPLALLIHQALPSALSDSARFCQRLNGSPRRWTFFWRHLEPAHWVSAAVLFIIALHEFELASLLQRPAWTVVIFDAQVMGYELTASLRRILVPFGLQLLLLGFVFIKFKRLTVSQDTFGVPARTHYLWSFVGVATVVTVGIPLIQVLRDAWSGVPRLLTAFSMQREVLTSVLIASAVGLLTVLIARRLAKQPGKRLAIFLLPGLLGPLILALVTLAFFQKTPLRVLYDSPFPMIMALTALVLPTAILGAYLIALNQRSQAVWLTSLTNSPLLRWKVAGHQYFWLWAYAVFASYFEITASSILAPPSATPVLVRLYNLMHYGRDTMLSAYLLVTLLVPIIFLGVCYGSVRWIAKRRG